MRKPVEIAYFSDVLCVWAYVSQIRLDELQAELAANINISYRFISVFGCTASRIGAKWEDRGGFDGYARHVAEVGDLFPHVKINPAAWTRCRPRSSASCHLFLKALQTLEEGDLLTAVEPEGRTPFEEFAWLARRAFFEDARDIGNLDTLYDLAREMDLPTEAIADSINSGAAMAALCRDLDDKDLYRIEGSPTYLLNNGRQKLYGNVGYRIIEANIRELLENPEGQASWC